MMAILFLILTAGLGVGWFGSRKFAILLVSVALIGAVKLFLWEVYSPEYGFSMPWIDT